MGCSRNSGAEGVAMCGDGKEAYRDPAACGSRQVSRQSVQIGKKKKKQTEEGVRFIEENFR
jgi:hypothetical protein